MRILNISALALCGGLAFATGCSEEPAKLLSEPPAASPKAHASVTRIEAGPGCSQAGTDRLDRRKGRAT